MKIGEMKSNILLLIEEASSSDTTITSDSDLNRKLPNVINYIQIELARIRKVLNYVQFSVTKNQVIDLSIDISDNFYQLKIIKGVKYEIIENLVIFQEDGIADIYYYILPDIITSNTNDNVDINLPIDLLAIMPYGVAGDILKGDPSNEYGVIYYNRYKELKSELDPRFALQTIEMEGGVDF